MWGGSWAFGASLIPCSPCFYGQAGPERAWGVPGSPGQWHPGPYYSHPLHSFLTPGPGYGTCPPRPCDRRSRGNFPSSPWRSRPGGVPRSAGSPPARLGVPVVLDGQPQLAPVQGAAHAQAQLQVLIAQTQQHLFPRKGGLGDPSPPRTAERQATEGPAGGGCLSPSPCLPSTRSGQSTWASQQLPQAGAPGGEWVTI